MSYIVKPVNSTVTLGILIRENGEGISGLYPTAEIRRISDSKYFNFAAVSPPYWITTGGQREKVLSPASWQDGLYQWEFNQETYDEDALEEYEILYRNDSPYKLIATEVMAFTKMGLTTVDIEAIRSAIWNSGMTPGGVQADMIMNLMWAMAKGRMELGEENKINVYNDDDSYYFTIQLTPVERTTSNLMAGNLPTYGSAGRYQPNTNPDPELCMVYGVLRYPTGEPVADNDIEVYVEDEDLPQFAQHYLLTGKSVIFHTDENGYFQADLIRNALVILHVKESEFQCKFTVPDADEMPIENIPGTYGYVVERDNPL
jgi:hypothetical protein